MNWRKLNRITHRDLGYIFFGMSIIYGLSGIALNHLNDWNPNYVVTSEVYPTSLKTNASEAEVLSFLNEIGHADEYKKHYSPSGKALKIFINHGSIMVDTQKGEANLETLTRRPVFYQFNYLHYNHAKKLFTWFSDAFAISLMLLAITGLFMLKGKQGITSRGAWLTVIGIIIPLVLFLMYF